MIPGTEGRDSHAFIHADDCGGTHSPGCESQAGEPETIPDHHAYLICVKCNKTLGRGTRVRDVNLSAYYRKVNQRG